MPSVLFCWELGAGFGHLNPHREVLHLLQQRGYSVHVAVRDLTRAVKAFEGLPFHYWQAPTPQKQPELMYNPTYNFTQILHNTGLGDPTGLAARIAAWRNIFTAVRPSVALVDYCPTALMALRSTSIPTVVTGTGFFIPPNVTPFPAFPMMDHLTTRDKLADEERRMLLGINAALAMHQIPPLNSMAQLFHEVAGKIFRSLPEFDHYPHRGPAEFLGIPSDPPRNPVQWPSGDGPRVFAYLKPFDSLEPLLNELKQRKLPTIVACDGINRVLRQKHAAPTISFAPPNVDIGQMGREAHFAITNANLTTSVRLLLQGCPLMTIPLHLEQLLVALNFNQRGVGVALDPKRPADIPPLISDLLDNSQYRVAARALATKYERQPDDYVERAVGTLEGVLGRSSSAYAPTTTPNRNLANAS